MGRFIPRRKHNHDIQCEVVAEYGQTNTDVDFPHLLRIEKWFDKGVQRGDARLYLRKMYEDERGSGNFLPGKTLGLTEREIDLIVQKAEVMKAALRAANERSS